MLKGLVTWFLNNYLGKYLENLNADQLSIALLSGEVELENVPLRRDALRFLDPTLNVEKGIVGRIKLKIPVSHVRSEPWTIEMEKVYVVIKPQRHEDYDDLQDETVSQEIKLAALDGIESEWRAIHDVDRSASYYPTYSAWMSYGTSFIGTIVENLQLVISDVHIRLEDDLSNPTKPFACGFSLESLAAQSCDDNWTPKFVHRELGDNMAYKLVELENMTVYVNPDAEMFSVLSNEELLSKMSIRCKENIDEKQFILTPVTATATIKRNCSEKPLSSRKTPRIVCHLDLGEVEFNVTDLQYQSCVITARTLHQLKKNRKFWRWRPHEKVKENPRGWWQYAITCQMETIHERNQSLTKEFMLQRARDNVKYVEAFTKYLENPVVFDTDLKEHKDDMDACRSYEELKILRNQAVIILERQLRSQAITREPLKEPPSPSDSDAAAQTLLQRWFPLWGGWHGSAPNEEVPTQSAEHRNNQSALEDEIIEALADEATNIVPYKDMVFLQASFSMTRGSTRLYATQNDASRKLMFEFEFSETKIDFENRPRAVSNKFALSLGAVSVKDLVTEETVFPVLISPQNLQGAPLFAKKSLSSKGSGLSGLAKTFQSYIASGIAGNQGSTASGPLFYILYEKRPFGLPRVDYRLHISCQPLNIVYNPAVVNCVANFFKIPDDLNKAAQLSQKIRNAAISRIEEVKQKTKEELRRNINHFFDDSSGLSRKKLWDVHLDLSAPQIIVPEDFVDKEAAIMVLDLGKLQLENEMSSQIRRDAENSAAKQQSSSSYYSMLPFSSSSAKSPVAKNDDDSEDEDEFLTPASSPVCTPPLDVSSPPIVASGSTTATTTLDFEAAISNKIYEKYAINLSDMQIIVGRVKDNWKHAHIRGISTLHVLDKFSIALQCERRLVATDDPNLPNIAISGTLPKLNVHVNEDKIFILDRISRLFLQDPETEPLPSCAKQVQVSGEQDLDDEPETDEEDFPSLFDWGRSSEEGLDESAKLLLLYFCIADMSVELQSMGKSIVELQVTGVKASFTKRVSDVNLGLSVHSLLLVDAMQTLGSNFELLVASHKNVMVDSVSGSLRGSDPVSPRSPSSPNPTSNKQTSPSEIANALSALQKHKYSGRITSASPVNVPSLLDFVDPDALISVDILIINPRSSSVGLSEKVNIVSIQFNSLDVIANQETIVELISFARRVMPEPPPVFKKRKLPTSDAACQTDENVPIAGQHIFETPKSVQDRLNYTNFGASRHTNRMVQTEISADFQRLNVLLLRAVTGKMIGTALLTEVRIHSTLQDTFKVSGSIGGLQVNSLLPGLMLHQRIISVGKDPASEEFSRARSTIHSDLYHQTPEFTEKQALTFSIQQHYAISRGKASGPATIALSKKTQKFEIELRMASVCYLHSTPFLKELNSCAKDFVQFLSKLAASIRSAAADLALGIVQRRTDSISLDVWTPSKSNVKPLRNPETSRAPASTPVVSGAHLMPFLESNELEIYLDAVLETPVIVLPRNERSNEVLVAHLGMITIGNEILRDDTDQGPERTDRVSVNINNMSVHSMDLIAQIRNLSGLGNIEVDLLEVLSIGKSMSAEVLYSSSANVAMPILHDTHVFITIEKSSTWRPSQFGSEFLEESISVNGGIMSSLKVSLLRSQYDLLVDALQNLLASPPNSRSEYSEKVDVETEIPIGSGGHQTIFETRFTVPLLQFELCSDSIGQLSKPIVNIQLEDFVVKHSLTDAEKSTTEVTLGSVVIEDLSLSYDSPHRKLASSICTKSDKSKRPNLLSSRRSLSASCPLLPQEFSLNFPNKGLSKNNKGHQQPERGSLPHKLDAVSLFDSSYESASVRLTSLKACPSTPPPTTCGSPVFVDDSVKRCSGDNLVQVRIVNISRDFVQKHNDTAKFVDVDFNTLDIVFNLKSWVMILDFFGIGSPKPASSSNSGSAQECKPASTTSGFKENSPPPTNSAIDIKVKALSVVLNHSNYEVAHVSVAKFDSRLSLRGGNFAIEGALGKFLVLDLTSRGALYRDRFLSTQGHDSVLKFAFFKYGNSEEAASQPHDATLKLRMASIIYVHTQRFWSELLAFFNHFHQHQNVMNRIREAAMGSKVSETAARGIRLKLDIEADSPLLLLPVSTSSTKLIVVHLGSLEVSNCFKFAGDDGTISAQTLRSALASQLLGKRRRSSSRSSRSSGRSRSRRSGIKSPASNASSVHHSRTRQSRRCGFLSASEEDEELGDEGRPANNAKCLLDVLSISLSSIDLRTADRLSVFTDQSSVDDILVGGFIVRQHRERLLQQKCELHLQIERNLDKAFSHQVPDLSINGGLSRVHATLHSSQYQTIRGLLSYNLGENLDDLMQFNAAVSTSEYQEPEMHTLLSGVVWTNFYMNIELQDVTLDLQTVSSIARVNFLKSLLTYESFSDSSRDIDLVSQDILLNDLRFTDLPMNKRPSVFPHILQPLSSINGEARSLLQAEVHFRLTPDSNRITILVNNMRLMGIFDWWLQVLDFISQAPAGEPAAASHIMGNSEVVVAPEAQKHCMSEEPLYPSAGIVSRRAPVVESQGPVFELKVSITDSDFIIVADPSLSDSAAVILRSTTVLAYRPDMVDRPFSCNLNNAEVFSCLLGNEEESALSIIDPVTINFEIAGRNVPGMPSRGLSDLLVDQKDGYNRLGTYERTAEIQLQQLNVRLSYHDWVMFHKILESFPRQAQEALQREQPPLLELGESQFPDNARFHLAQLADLGFRLEDCCEALRLSNGQLDEAALWLTQNAEPAAGGNAQEKQYYLQGTNVSFTNFECKVSGINICIIDDCRDADVPLIELTMQRLHLHHDFEGIGEASAMMSSSYYNRSLSAWEPFMEPWRCTTGWKIDAIGPGGLRKRLSINADAEETVNFNFTSSLIELYHAVKADWTAESSADLPHDFTTRRRAPFVPYCIRNESGVDLRFCTHIKNPGSTLAPTSAHVTAFSSKANADQKWLQVREGDEVQFSFEETRSKTRNLYLGDVKAHQVIIKLSGWQEVAPVSIDRVGTYFRKAVSETGCDLPPIRVVFDVALKGSAMKLVTIRSALTIQNRLNVPVELKLENVTMKSEEHLMDVTVHPNQVKSVPLNFVWAKILARPTSSGGHWQYSSKAIEWYHIRTPTDNTLTAHSSLHLWNAEAEPARFCVAVRRKNYPLEAYSRTPQEVQWIQPAHAITFISPLTIVNLLPCHLTFRIIGGEPIMETNISPGKEYFASADIEKNVRLEFSLDLYPKAAELLLPPGRHGFELKLEVGDSQNRRLDLTARVEPVLGGAVKVSLFAKHWLVNKTGLPLIFRQEGSSIDAPGQEEENEMARLAAPLMFSFSEVSETSSSTLMMRVGGGLHKDGTPQWCRSFPLIPGSRVRKLSVIPNDSRRVGRVYIIGIDVRVGKGRYRDTLIITLSPRFQVYNQSQFKMQFSQHCFASTFHDLEAEASHLQAYPQSCLAFHWPRLDREQLLCLRLVSNESSSVSMWSGGFAIDRVDSFHVAVREKSGRSIFIRVEVSLIPATYCIVLTDAANFPPPFRIDNFAEVAVTCHQSGVNDETLKTIVKPQQSLPFAWDEPSLAPHITCCAPGGSEATYNMNVIGEGSQLTYENFIYIAMTESFKENNQSDNLVFDVEGCKVFLASKEAGKRSQLWRMTSNGMLQHEGSSPPQDPSRSHQDDVMRNGLVLDIAGPAVQPNTYVPLMLRKPDERRQLTQRWRFTEDGRLMCSHRGLYAQANEGYRGLKKGCDVILGPTQPVSMERTPSGIPIEQSISRQRLRPGSGSLCVRVTTDGPTRVLQVIDVNRPSNKPFAKVEEQARSWMVLGDTSQKSKLLPPPGQAVADELEILVKAKHGIGFSLVSREPHQEELVYAFMSNVMLEYQRSEESTLLDGSVQNMQIDNQIPGAQSPVVLFVSPANKNDEYRHMPAVSFSVNKSNSSHDNAEIYKHMMVQVKNISLNVEEELLCKVLKFSGITRSDEEMERMDESAYDAQHALIVSTRTAKRFYFGTLKLALNQIKLSVTKSHKLAEDLVAVKRKLGLSLIAFEDALIDLDPFVRVHPFETITFLTNAVVKHYADELLSQAVLILGATDFLGNPIGFFNDVSEGFTGLVSEGDVGGLLKNVAHGAANSAAKVTGSLSYGISKATVYDKYNEKRLMLRRQRGDTSKEYLLDGLKGLGFGVVQGLTSVVTETYDGVANDGVSGFFSGLTWGFIGTFSKPALGILDLATGAATAVKESSRSKSRELPSRMRPPRLVIGPGGVMPIYSRADALGQELLFKINSGDFTEVFVAHELLRSGSEENLQALISCARVIVFASHAEEAAASASNGAVDSKSIRVMVDISHGDLVCARTLSLPGTVSEEAKYYIELVGKLDSNSAHTRPQIRCDNERIARTVTQKINYARNVFDETTQAVIDDTTTNNDDDQV